MRKTHYKGRLILEILLAVMIFIFVAGSPGILTPRSGVDVAEENQSTEGRLAFKPLAPVTRFIQYCRNLTTQYEEARSNTGQSGVFSYLAGKTERDVRDTLPRHFMISLAYTLPALILSLFIGTSTGIYLEARNSTIRRGTLAFLSTLPDFIFAVLLQMMTIFTFQSFGLRLGRIAFLTEKPAITLPLASLVFVACTFVIRSTSHSTARITTQDYILFAKARGLSSLRIYTRHVLPGVLITLEEELPKIVGMMVGNLFMVERIFNIPGITRFLFSYSFIFSRQDLLRGEFVVQYPVILFGLSASAVLFLILRQAAIIVLSIIRKEVVG